MRLLRASPSLRMRSPLGAACALGALAGLVLLFNSEVLVARRRGADPAADATWSSLARAQPYVYAYAATTLPFPMLSLGERAPPGCPGGPRALPYVTVKEGGRLGNLVLEYASVWSLARTNRLPAFVPDELLHQFKKVFERPSLRGAREVLGGDAWCRAALGGALTSARRPEGGATESAGAEEGAASGQLREPWTALTPVNLGAVSLQETLRRARRDRSIIVLDICSLLPEAVVPVAAELRKELRFLPQLRESAQKELHRLRKEHFPKGGEVVFGAVHARRTDYHHHLELLYNVTRPAGLEYYLAAATWLRRGLPEHQRLLLVVCSDDPEWAQEVLVPALAAVGETERAGGGWAAAWAGSGDTLRPARDLALLAACNHSVFAYGTFGLTAALLAGGRAAVYQLAREPLHPTLLTPSEQYARHMPGWVALR